MLNSPQSRRGRGCWPDDDAARSRLRGRGRRSPGSRPLQAIARALRQGQHPHAHRLSLQGLRRPRRREDLDPELDLHRLAARHSQCRRPSALHGRQSRRPRAARQGRADRALQPRAAWRLPLRAGAVPDRLQDQVLVHLLRLQPRPRGDRRRRARRRHADHAPVSRLPARAAAAGDGGERGAAPLRQSRSRGRTAGRPARRRRRGPCPRRRCGVGGRRELLGGVRGQLEAARPRAAPLARARVPRRPRRRAPPTSSCSERVPTIRARP